MDTVQRVQDFANAFAGGSGESAKIAGSQHSQARCPSTTAHLGPRLRRGLPAAGQGDYWGEGAAASARVTVIVCCGVRTRQHRRVLNGSVNVRVPGRHYRRETHITS